jgi:hypothetical protein
MKQIKILALKNSFPFRLKWRGSYSSNKEIVGGNNPGGIMKAVWPYNRDCDNGGKVMVIARSKIRMFHLGAQSMNKGSSIILIMIEPNFWAQILYITLREKKKSPLTP